MHILLIDNYDSFTFNLVQLLRESGVSHSLSIVKNNSKLKELPEGIDKILISPGPGLPDESFNLMAILNHYIAHPILGVCLGHQAIALHFGCLLKQVGMSFHGYAAPVLQNGEKDYLFEGLPESFVCGRYHSWVVDPDRLSTDIEVIALDQQDNIMAIRHKTLDIRGVQFHPESYITGIGQQIINNWLRQ